MLLNFLQAHNSIELQHYHRNQISASYKSASSILVDLQRVTNELFENQCQILDFHKHFGRTILLVQLKGLIALLVEAKLF